MYCVTENKRDANEKIMQTLSQVDWMGLYVTRVTYKQRQLTCWNSYNMKNYLCELIEPKKLSAGKPNNNGASRIYCTNY